MPLKARLTVLLGASQAGVELIRDMQTGFLQRVLDTPAPRAALLLGKVGSDVGRLLVQAVERQARDDDFAVLALDVRETQRAAIGLYRALDFVQWGTNPLYARVDGRIIAGLHFHKILRDIGPLPEQQPE